MTVFYKALNILGVVFAIWFALTSWIWIYWGALYIAYPFGLIGLLILLFSPLGFAKKPLKIILLTGVSISLIGLLMVR